MVGKSVRKMINKKAPGLSTVSAEMVKEAGETGVDMITVERDISEDWELSTIANYYKWKGNSLEKGN